VNAALGAVWSLTSLVCQERQRLASAGGQGVLFRSPSRPWRRGRPPAQTPALAEDAGEGALKNWGAANPRARVICRRAPVSGLRGEETRGGVVGSTGRGLQTSLRSMSSRRWNE